MTQWPSLHIDRTSIVLWSLVSMMYFFFVKYFGDNMFHLVMVFSMNDICFDLCLLFFYWMISVSIYVQSFNNNVHVQYHIYGNPKGTVCVDRIIINKMKAYIHSVTAQKWISPNLNWDHLWYHYPLTFSFDTNFCT